MKALFVLFAMICTAIGAFAQPFLVCSKVLATDPTQPVTSYTVTGLGTLPITVPAFVNSDKSTQLHLDLSLVPLGSFTAGLPNGIETVTATATNMWGTSAASVPFTFTKSLPVTVTGISLSSQ
jgi:hypothetical protein